MKASHCGKCSLKRQNACRDESKCNVLSREEIINLCCSNEFIDESQIGYFVDNFTFIRYEDKFEIIPKDSRFMGNQHIISGIAKNSRNKKKISFNMAG